MSLIRVPIYSADSNPLVDPPLIRKGHAYVQGLIDSGRAIWLSSSSRPCAQLLPTLQPLDDRTLLVRNGSGAINHIDVVMNACYQAAHSSRARMAHVKVRMWPLIGDDRAPRITGA